MELGEGSRQCRNSLLVDAELGAGACGKWGGAPGSAGRAVAVFSW